MKQQQQKATTNNHNAIENELLIQYRLFFLPLAVITTTCSTAFTKWTTHWRVIAIIVLALPSALK